MRKLILACIALFTVVLAEAQIEKGAVQLGGSVSFNNREVGDFDLDRIVIAPQAGLFVSETTSIGLLLSYSSITQGVFNQGTGSLQDATNNEFQFGVYARFHKPVVENLYLFLQPSLAIGSGENEFGNPAIGDTNSFNAAVSPGITYFISPKFALELRTGGISYRRVTLDNNGTETTDTSFDFGFSLGTVGIGMNFFIK